MNLRMEGWPGTTLTSGLMRDNLLGSRIGSSGVLDEAFGVAANKQGVRLKGYVVDAIGDDITTLNEEIKRF
jgi:hypothetical protein